MAALLLTVLLGAAPASAETLSNGARAEVPIHYTFIEGAIRLWVPITVAGSEPIAAILDTGSVELLVLRDAVPEAADLPDAGTINSSFGSGDSLFGHKTLAALALGEGSAGVDVPLGVIDRVECLPSKPDCPGGKMPFADYGFASEGKAGEGFKAILGIGMGNTQAGNPLNALGVSRWIVIMPIPGVLEIGKLILNPSDADLAGFQLLQSETAFVGPQGEVAGAMQGCLLLRDTGERVCLPICLDTGAAGMTLVTESNDEFQRVRSGGRFRLEFGGDSANLGFDIDIPPIGFTLAAPEPDSRSPRHLLFAGIRPYVFYEVLYDSANNQVGLKPR